MVQIRSKTASNFPNFDGSNTFFSQIQQAHGPQLQKVRKFPGIPNSVVEKQLKKPSMKSQVKINKTLERKIMNIFLLITFNICFGYSKEPSH